MATIVQQRPRRGSRTATASPAVVLRMAPPLDPPCDETFTRPATQPPPGMDQLPVPWPGAPSHPQRRPLPAPRPDRPTTARAAAQRFVGMCVEVLNGYRPTTQLRPLIHPKHFTDISDQLLRRTVRVRMSPAQAAHHGRLVRARRMLLCEPANGVVEAAVVLEQGPATWAMAIRMEHTPAPGIGVLGWLCTVVQVI